MLMIILFDKNFLLRLLLHSVRPRGVLHGGGLGDHVRMVQRAIVTAFGIPFVRRLWL